jgi:hypothetical protein
MEKVLAAAVVETLDDLFAVRKRLDCSVAEGNTVEQNREAHLLLPKIVFVNRHFFALVCGLVSVMALSLGGANATQPAEGKSAAAERRYAAYWLTRADGANEYRMLLIARMPLPDLAKLMKRLAELENVINDAPAPQILERPALTIATYKKDSIWNDGVPLKPLTRFKNLSETDRTVDVQDVKYNYEQCPLEDVVRLLKSPEGKQPIHRLHAPLAGMEQTARALRLLIEEQMKDDEAKKMATPGGNR